MTVIKLVVSVVGESCLLLLTVIKLVVSVVGDGDKVSRVKSYCLKQGNTNALENV